MSLSGYCRAGRQQKPDKPEDLPVFITVNHSFRAKSADLTVTQPVRSSLSAMDEDYRMNLRKFMVCIILYNHKNEKL